MDVQDSSKIFNLSSEKRLELLKELGGSFGLTLGFWDMFTEGMELETVRGLIKRLTELNVYRQSLH